MSGTLVFPDAVEDLRQWLRQHPLLADLTGERWFFRIPDEVSGAPFGRLYRVGGGPQASEAPIQDLRIAHEVWGKVDSDYTAVRQTVLALESLYQVASNVLMNNSTALLNARVTGALDAPDPDTGVPRMVCDVLATVSLP